MDEHDEQLVFEMGYNKGFKDGIKGSIPKAEIKKFLEEGTKDVDNNVLAIVREDYIHKSVYKARLKADMVAMLEDLRLDFQEAELAGVLDNKELIFADEVDDLVQQKINELKAESEDKE